MSLMLYNDIWMDATYVILCVAWMQILDSPIPSMKQCVPKQSQMLTTLFQLPHSSIPPFFQMGFVMFDVVAPFIFHHQSTIFIIKAISATKVNKHTSLPLQYSKLRIPLLHLLVFFDTNYRQSFSLQPHTNYRQSFSLQPHPKARMDFVISMLSESQCFLSSPCKSSLSQIGRAHV